MPSPWGEGGTKCRMRGLGVVMQIISGDAQFHIDFPTAVAIGKFDGVHMGHQKLLKHILDKKEQGMKATIFTFDPPPAVFFSQLAKETNVKARKDESSKNGRSEERRVGKEC